MKTTIKRTLQSLLLVPALALGVSATMPVLQPDVANAQQAKITEGVQKAGTNTSSVTNLGTLIQRVVNVLLIIVGAVSVIMLIWGGFKYITSSGDSSAVTSAKNTILYAVIGLVVALLAFAIVNFVVNAVTTNTV